MLKRLPVLVMVALATAVSAQAPQPVRAVVGATVVDGTGSAPIRDAVILIRDGRIIDVGPASRVTIPQGAQRTDVKGKTILPGFVNAHGHANVTNGLQSGEQFNTRENVERQVRLYADYGVTSVFSLGGDGAAGVAVRAAPAVGRGRLFIAGPDVAGRTPEATAAEVDALIAQKVDWVKVRLDDNLGTAQKIPREAVKAAIDRAHAAKLPVAAHIFYLDDAKYLLRNGLDLVAHSVRDLPVDAEFIKLVRERDVCYVPTLMREVSTYVYESTPEFFSDPFFLRRADRVTVEGLKAPARQQQVRTSKTAPRYKVALEQATRNLKTLRDAGVRIAMGTDTGPVGRFQGYFEHLELEMMVKAGLTPMQAIVAATGDAARCMKKAGEIGTIQKGAWADFVVYGASPLDDIRNTRTLESVTVAGAPLTPTPPRLPQ
jgi:imidazolonepropionase-like amidohydrolase